MASRARHRRTDFSNSHTNPWKLGAALMPPTRQTRSDCLDALIHEADALLEESKPGTETALASIRECVLEDVKPKDLSRFFEAYVALHQREPWRLIPSAQHLLELSCDEPDMRKSTCCLIDQTGMNKWLILFDKLSDYKHYCALGKDPGSLKRGHTP